MKDNQNIQHPYIGDIDIDWEEERRLQKELNWERYEEALNELQYKFECIDTIINNK